MADNVLVAYASKYGGTEEIAEKIGGILKEDGLQVDVVQADRVTDLTRYDAFIIGSAVYIGQWRKEAVKFIRSNENTLAGMPVWLFASGPTGEGDPVELLKGWRYPGRLQSTIDHMKPRDIAVFNGMIDMNKLNFFDKFIVKIVKPQTGDSRDWDAITSWAKNIAGELKK